jgi:hypothetical protein
MHTDCHSTAAVAAQAHITSRPQRLLPLLQRLIGLQKRQLWPPGRQLLQSFKVQLLLGLQHPALDQRMKLLQEAMGQQQQQRDGDQVILPEQQQQQQQVPLPGDTLEEEQEWETQQQQQQQQQQRQSESWRHVLEVLQYQTVALLLGREYCQVPEHLVSSSSSSSGRRGGGSSSTSSTAQRGKARRVKAQKPAVDANVAAGTAATAADNAADDSSSSSSSSDVVGRLPQSALRQLLEPRKLPLVQCSFKVGWL